MDYNLMSNDAFRTILIDRVIDCAETQTDSSYSPRALFCAYEALTSFGYDDEATKVGMQALASAQKVIKGENASVKTAWFDYTVNGTVFNFGKSFCSGSSIPSMEEYVKSFGLGVKDYSNQNAKSDIELEREMVDGVLTALYDVLQRSQSGEAVPFVIDLSNGSSLCLKKNSTVEDIQKRIASEEKELTELTTRIYRIEAKRDAKIDEINKTISL